MVIRPLLRYAVLYAVVELAVMVLLARAIGVGWMLVVLAATFMAGVVLAASQLRGQVNAIRRSSPRRGRSAPQAAATDGVLVGLGSLLVFLPGMVSTAAGALMLAPPTRAAMRPLASAMLDRGLMRAVGALNIDQLVNADRMATRTGHGDYIDGEVIGEQVHRPAAARTVIARRAGG